MPTAYGELKVEAKKLGLGIHGKSAVVLAEQVRVKAKELGRKIPEAVFKVKEEARAKARPVEAKSNTSTIVMNGKKETEVRVESEKEKFNAILVVDGKREIRKYSLAIHGEKFAELAERFAKSSGYGTMGISTGDKITCPSCGHSFAPRK